MNTEIEKFEFLLKFLKYINEWAKYCVCEPGIDRQNRHIYVPVDMSVSRDLIREFIKGENVDLE